MSKHREVRAITRSIHQWLEWEQQDNVVGYERPAAPEQPPTAQTEEAVTVDASSALDTPPQAQPDTVPAPKAHVALGSGNHKARLLFVCDGLANQAVPEATPWDGEAGQLLERMITAMGFQRQEIYLCHRIERHSHEGLAADDSLECRQIFQTHIHNVQPEVIVTLGPFATQLLLEIATPLTELRGHYQQYMGIPVMPTFHPDTLLKHPEQKRATWSDLKQVMATLASATNTPS